MLLQIKVMFVKCLLTNQTMLCCCVNQSTTPSILRTTSISVTQEGLGTLRRVYTPTADSGFRSGSHSVSEHGCSEKAENAELASFRAYVHMTSPFPAVP